MTRRTHTEVEVRRVHHIRTVPGDDRPAQRIYTRVSTVGHAGTRPFLLIPGIGVSANYFERLAFQLNEFGPVIALDLPGFGGVPHPSGPPLTIGDFAELVGDVIDELGLSDPVVVGHSMGTQVVAELASRRTFSDVVLLSPVLNPPYRRRWVALAKFLQSSVHESPRIVGICLYAYLLCGPRWYWRVLPEVLRYRMEDVLPKVTANALVVAGDQDALCPREWLQRVADLLPQAQVWQLPDAAHSVMHGNAEDVARLCIDHARRNEPDDDKIRTVDHDSQLEPDASPADLQQSLRGRATEFIGIVRGDDAQIAAGKTKHAEAAESAAADDAAR